VTRLPRGAAVLLRWLAPPGEADDVIGDLEEAHRRRLRRQGAIKARLLTALAIGEMSAALMRVRAARARVKGIDMVQDYKLGLRMLLKYPGLTIAGGLALAIAIGVGSAWYDVTSDFLRPSIPLPGGDRIVEIEMRNLAGGGDERRLLHDYIIWRRDARSIVDLGVYRTVERNLVLGTAKPEAVTIAETTAAAFRVAQVPPLLGRPLLDADEQPGATPVVVLGYRVWQQQFAGRPDVVGRTVQLGDATTTVVGVMPDGFAFPVNHRLWVPLQLRTSEYLPLEGPAVQVYGRIAPNATRAQANAELTALAERTAADSPLTHDRLRPRVLAYGGQSPGDRGWLELAITHLPILLMLIIACTNVGTLVYARTATREAEIATRYALGAGRARIVTQLFVEALVLASVAAIVGLSLADRTVRWGVGVYYSGMAGGPPFWVDPGLKPATILYAALLTIAGAAILGVLPALKVTSSHVHTQLRTLGVGGATLRFGTFWTTAMIVQVALTVILLPPAIGISEEALRDRRIRSEYPTGQYLAIRLELDRDPASAEAAAGGNAMVDNLYAEFERRIAREPGVRAVTFADRLPGMAPAVRTGEAEVTSGSTPVLVPNLWTASVGPGFFEAFDVPLIAGRGFNDSDRTAGGRTVIVNEAFARLYMGGATPVGRRVRYASANPAITQPWFDIVGMVRDIGMTPTDRGEAPYMFTPSSVATAPAIVVAVRVNGDPAALAPRVRAIAADLNAGLRLDEVRSLDDITWGVDVPMMIGAGAIASVVSLGLFLSAAGIFSLMSVSVARRTREIGLRAALGASRGRLMAGVFSRALLLIGSGIAAGNVVLMLFVGLSDEAELGNLTQPLLLTSSVMLLVGLLACIEPARRALRIQPTDALKEA
jgi:putative ABC transport system permease protein